MAAGVFGKFANAKDVVTIKLPAAGAYLSVLRTATAGLAARLDFTLDEIEDLRIAVDEACAILLSIAPAQAEVTSQFEVTDSALSIDVSVPITGHATLDYAGRLSAVADRLNQRTALQVRDFLQHL